MKTSGKVLIAVLIVAVLVFIYWKFILKTSKIDLASGNTIYMRGGNYYVNSNGDEAKIDLNEYNRLKNEVAGTCTNPNPTTYDVTPCDYYGYKGQINDCGDCEGVFPLVKNCPAKGASCDNGTGILTLTGADKTTCHYSCFKSA